MARKKKKNKSQKQAISKSDPIDKRISGKPERQSPFLANWPYVVILFLLAVFFFRALLKTDWVVQGSDVALSFYYYHDFSYRMLRDLCFPFWNPYVFAGTPYFSAANGLYYLPHYFFFLLPTPLAINLNLILHFFLAGAFCFGFLRSIGIKHIGSMVGGIMYMSPIIEILHVFGGHIPRLEARAWIPFVFWMYYGFHKRHSAIYFLLGALGIAFQIFTGHVQIVFYTLFCLAAYFIFLSFTSNDFSIFKNAYRFVLFCLAGVVISGVQLLPTLMWSTGAGRAQTYEFATSFSFPPLNIVTALVPYIWGDKVDMTYFGPSYIWESMLFVSITSVALVLASAILDRKKATLFFLGMMTLCFVVALGKYTPIYKAFYYAVPGYKFFRVPGRILTVFVFFVSVLSGIGVSSIIENGKEKTKEIRVFLIVLFSIFSVLLIGYLYFFFTNSKSETFHTLLKYIVSNMRKVPADIDRAVLKIAENAHDHMGNQVGLAAAGFAAILLSLGLFLKNKITWKTLGVSLIILLFIEQNLFSQRYIKTTSKDRFRWEAPIEKLLEKEAKQGGNNSLFRVMDSRRSNNLDKGMMYNVSSLNGYEPGILERYNRFVNLARNKPLEKYYAVLKFRRYHPMLKLLNLKYVFDHSRSRIQSKHLKEIYNKRGLRILENTNPLPRAWIVYNTHIEKDPEKILSAIHKGRFDFRRTVMLENSEAKEIGTSAFDRDMKESQNVEIGEYSANYIKLEADLAREGYLVLSEIFYPGWNAYVDGETAPIYRANYILRAVHLEKGRHVVEMSFTPRLFWLGFWLSLGCLIVCVGYVVLERWAQSRTI
ncbi:MAG: YfhO family protein [Proteobacteria bacterium]|nr:YfhO family protein [Pseudomonadota bacterium]